MASVPPTLYYFGLISSFFKSFGQTIDEKGSDTSGYIYTNMKINIYFYLDSDTIVSNVSDLIIHPIYSHIIYPT